MSPPFISEYKKNFILKQFVQTFFGGLKIFSPVVFILIQIVIFLIPAILLCLVNLGNSNANLKWRAIFTGCSIFLVDLFLALVILLLKRERSPNDVIPIENLQTFTSSDDVRSRENTTSIAILANENNQDTNFLSEEDRVINEGGLKPSTWIYIAPNVSLSLKYIYAITISSLSFGLCTPLLTSQNISPVLRGFAIFAITIARYSCIINSPSEIATFNASKSKHFLYRPFYAALVGASYNILDQFAEREEAGFLTLHSAILACLPILWVSGILPSLDALFPWVVETILGIVSFGSPSFHYFGSIISLIVVILCPIMVFVITQEPLVIILLECLCGYIISCDTGRMITMKSTLCEETPTKSFLKKSLQPTLIIAFSLLCVLIVWLNVPKEDVYEYQLVFAIISLLVSTLSWTFQDVGIAIVPEVSKFALVPLSIMYGLLTYLLHSWLTLSVQHDDNLWSAISSSEKFSLGQLVPYLLTIRAFSMPICEPRLTSLDFTLAFLWKTSMGDSKNMSFVLVVFVVSLITRRVLRFLKYLKMFCSIWYSSLVTTLLDSKIKISAIAVSTLPLSLSSFLIAIMIEGFTVTPLFTLPIFLLGFPRPMTFWNEKWFTKIKIQDKNSKVITLGPDLEPVDFKIYSEIGPLLIRSLAMKAYKIKLGLKKGSCFLARYEDRILFIRILSSCWNFAYMNVKGLEMQEQTSCHHQEAAEIDEKFGNSLNASSFLKNYLTRFSLTNLSPKFILKVPTYSESKSNISAIGNPKDKSIFQDMFYRAFSYLWIKNNPVLKGESYQRKMKSNKTTSTLALNSSPPSHSNVNNTTGLSGIDSKQNNPLLNSKEFSVTNALFKCTLPSVNLINLNSNKTQSTAIVSASESLTDINEGNNKVSLQDNGESSEIKSLSKQSTRSPSFDRSLDDKDPSVSDRLSLIWIKQCVGDVIPPNAIKARVEKLCRNIWVSVIGNDSDKEINLWEFFHENFLRRVKLVSNSSTPRKVNIEEITLKAFRYASKLTLDEMFDSSSDLTIVTLDEEREEEIFTQLTLYERDYEFCTRDEIPLKIHEKTNRIITIVKNPNSSDMVDSVMRILNYETEGVEFKVGQLDQFTVEGIWSNLNLELLYFTSDDDERFSIQNDRILLRNVVLQCAKAPFGYPVYDSVFRVNLFDFTVSQVD